MMVTSVENTNAFYKDSPESFQNPRRIFHVIPSLGEGGAERQLSLLAPALVQQGMECHVAYNVGGIHLGRMEESQVTVHPLPERGNANPARVADLVTLFRQVKPDIVQTWLTQMDVAGGLAARIAGCHHILSERASAAAYPKNWKNRVRCMVGQRAVAVIANSAAGAAYWHANRAHGPVIVIPNALVADAIMTAPADAALLPTQKLILSAGRFDEQKNMEMLIDGLDLALGQLPDHNAILFGDGPQRLLVEERVAKARHADRFRLPGFTRYLGYWRKHADVFVSVSHFEGQPNVVLEAANERCPLVVSDIPEHRECLSAAAAAWVDRHSAQSIADGIIETVLDPQLADKRRTQALADVSRFTLEAQVDLYCRTYSAVISGRDDNSLSQTNNKDFKWTF